jgi:N-acetylneuraminic acid mutarotase
LLALSTGLYKYATIKAQEFGTSTDAELTLILNRLSNDLADDGLLQIDFMDDFIRAIRSLSPKEIAENLRRRSIVDYPAGLTVPDISRFLNQCAGTAQCAWRSGAPMPAPSVGHAAASFGGKIYVFGGVTAGDSGAPAASAYTHARVYDPIANAWTALPPMPVGAYDLEAHAVGDKIYVVAGYGVNGFKNELMEYDPQAKAWALKSPNPTYRYIFTSSVVNGRIYVIGGQGTIDDGPWVSGKPWAFKDRVSIYDPATDTWSQGHAAPMPFGEAASCALGDKIYVFGGTTEAGLQAVTLEYDTASDSWASKSPMAVAKEGLGCVRVSDQFYLLGGRNSVALDALNRYDPATDTWTSPTRLPTARYWFGAEAVGGEIYVIGGWVESAFSTDVVEILNPLL